ncbi:hypothetical protein BELL_0070g00250 [Botrytis elliptica]|uniref:Uncharacterized protein n=1 Tax=Botrytis elliptica TaxID=278938 RepID=A0A4Z1K2Y4_9HELO|nr:hypothetical protein BELL_0070g00250 [Botrytis elliptica]
METLYKKIRSVRISILTHRSLYKDESSNEDVSKSSEGLLESNDNETLDYDIRPQNEKQRTPAAEALEYEKVFYNGTLFASSLYKGDPRPELDLAWHTLVKNNNLRISKGELDTLGRTALPLADGSGYYGQLNVYHHLHCLKFMREAFYAEYYPDAQGPTLKMHVALMCHADTSITTFEWEEGIRRPMPDFTGWHTCNNWEKLDDSATARAFSMFDQVSLINPTYGIAFTMVNGEIDYTPPGQEGFRAVWPEDFEGQVHG